MKSAGASTIVDAFTFGYCTFEVDTTRGGPGVSLDIAFFSGAGLGFGVNDTEAARFSSSGLPASDGAGACHFITVGLRGGAGFCLPDGEIGYSYCAPGPQATTGPVIGDISACPNGTVGAFDIYACGGDPATYAGTFFFGGSPTATFYMDITEDDGLTLASQTDEPGSGVNSNITSATVLPTLGATWDPTYTVVDGMANGSSGGGMSTLVWFDGRLANGAAITPFGEILVDPTAVFLTAAMTTIVGGVAAHSIPIAGKDRSLVDRGTGYVQGVRLSDGAPIFVSTRIEGNIGY